MASIPDYLSTLASEYLVRYWMPETNVILERQLWHRVMIAQQTLGLDIITDDEIVRSDVATHDVDLERIREREVVLRHDLKARLEEFAYLSGHEHAHLGMTSADVVENVALIKMQYSLRIMSSVYDLPLLTHTAARIPFRGIKGPVGTQQDMLDLLGSEEKCDRLDELVANWFGFKEIANSVPQVMYRSIDLEVASALVNAVSGIRHPLQAVVAGLLSMICSYQGDTWNEGDVSSSVVRRVALPGIFFATDALLAYRRGTLGG